MQGTYKRELYSSYFILEEQAMDSVQYYQMKMVTENKLCHLLPVSIHHFNGENQFYYDISGKQTLSCIFERKEVEAEQLIQILSGLSEALLELEGYLLEENYLCLNPEYMYMNVNTQQIFLCFYPFVETDFSKGIQEFSEYLLNRIDHQDEKAVAIGYQLYRLTREDNFVFTQILEEIFQEYAQPEKEQKKEIEQVMESAELPKKNEETFYEIHSEEALEHRKKISFIKEFKLPIFGFLLLILAGAAYIFYQYGNRATEFPFFSASFFGTKDMILAAGAVLVGLAGFILLYLYKRILESERSYETEESIQTQMEREYFSINERAYEQEECRLEDIEDVKDQRIYEETVLLKENLYKEEGILIEKIKKFDKRPPAKILLDHFPFVIGKLEDTADYVISDKSVSRIHAKFIKNPGEDVVYLMDLNSKNGTLKNGIPLETNEMVPLTAEDEITFGKVSYTYH